VRSRSEGVYVGRIGDLVVDSITSVGDGSGVAGAASTRPPRSLGLIPHAPRSGRTVKRDIALNTYIHQVKVVLA